MSGGAKYIYGPTGKVVRVVGQAGWDGASHGRRAYGWTPPTGHVNSMLAGDVATLRERGRDAVRRNPFALAASAAWVSSAIGKGIRPKANTNDEDLREQTVEAWEDFVDECDADGTSSFYGLQEIVARGAYEAGDGLLRWRPRRPSDGLAIPLQLQAFEAEQLDANKTEDLGNGRIVKAGIEFDRIGRRSAYWMFPNHPGDSVGWRGTGTSKRIPADQIIHVFHPLRAGQVRGVPGLASVLGILKEVLEVQDAYVLRTKIQNLFTSFETSTAPPNVFADGQVEDNPTHDADGVPLATLEPGMHRVLGPGKDVRFSDPPQGAKDYGDFMRVELRAIASGAGVTYEQLTGDLAGVTFSSIRAGLMEFRRRVEQYQHNVIIHQLCRPVWRRFFQTAVLAGRITIPESEQPRLRALMRAKWQPPGFEYVQPEKEVAAAVMRIRGGLSSRSREVSRTGIDVEVLDREIAADEARERRLGLVFGELSDGALDAAANEPDEAEETSGNADESSAADAA